MEFIDFIPEYAACSVALGFFDGLHPGHQAVIRSAKADGLPLVVLSIGSATRAAERLLIDDDRDSILDGLGVSSLLFPDFERIREMDGKSFFDNVLVRRLHAKRIACGYNFRFGRGASCDAAVLSSLCKAAGISCNVVDPVVHGGEVISSKLLRGLLSDGNVAEYAEVLGRRYSYRLPVATGNKIGRTLGFPTMNQIFPGYFSLPRFGVYASITRTPDGVIRPAVTNIGVRPTVGSITPLSETWIEDYSADLYGKALRVELVAFLRLETRFADLSQLKSAIISDARSAKLLTDGLFSMTSPDI